jgi:hypothetical protein
MRPEQRESWDAVISAAAGRAKDTPLGRVLMMVRHKVAFHYDPTQVGRAYVHRFGGTDPDTPLLSRGNMANSTRFYFADAVAEDALASFEDNLVVGDAAFGRNRLFEYLNVAIFHIVGNFIALRGRGFQEFQDDGSALVSPFRP